MLEFYFNVFGSVLKRPLFILKSVIQMLNLNIGYWVSHFGFHALNCCPWLLYLSIFNLILVDWFLQDKIFTFVFLLNLYFRECRKSVTYNLQLIFSHRDLIDIVRVLSVKFPEWTILMGCQIIPAEWVTNHYKK